jgi:hypothetical protein
MLWPYSASLAQQGQIDLTGMWAGSWRGSSTGGGVEMQLKQEGTEVTGTIEIIGGVNNAPMKL